jgi:hypothetical protein
MAGAMLTDPPAYTGQKSGENPPSFEYVKGKEEKVYIAQRKNC